MYDKQRCVDILSLVANGLKDLKHEVVFVGGVTTFAYLDSPVALDVRATDDVDCVVEVTTIFAYEKVKNKLTTLGFVPDSTSGAPICRWVFAGVKVDVMPTTEAILGFSNKWYPGGIKNKTDYILPNGETIFLFPLSFFLASKLEAYNSRGNNDPRTSSDIEDILLVVDGASDPVQEILVSDAEVKDFLGEQFQKLVKNDLFLESIEGLFQYEGPDRIKKVRSRLEQISN